MVSYDFQECSNFYQPLAGSSYDPCPFSFFLQSSVPFSVAYMAWAQVGEDKTFAGLSKGYIFTLRCTPPYCFTIPCLFMVYLNF